MLIKSLEPRSWKPLTLRTPFLASTIASSLALVLVLQWLLYQSQSNGGIIFAPDVNKIPLNQSFGYLYAPTIIAVCYSFTWTWIDLDVKRLEPYYELSKPQGAMAEKSLLLNYPFDFIASVPLKAARNRCDHCFTSDVRFLLNSP